VTRNLRIANGLLYAAAVIAIASGVRYIVTPTLLPYHERYLDVAVGTLPPHVIPLFLLIYRGAGWAQISIGVTLFMVIRSLLARGDRRGWWLVAVMMGLTLVPLLFITRAVGTYTPWWVIALLIVAVGVALALAWPETRRT
jgi:hypothetical protein